MATGIQLAEEPQSLAGKAAGHRAQVEVWFALTVLVGAILVAVFAERIAPYSPVENSLPQTLRPPFWMARGSSDHLLGTDRLGRDVLSRIVFGLRVSLTVSVLGGILLGVVAGSLSILSGYLGGAADAIVERLAETSLALPGILIALVLAMVRGPALENVLIVIVIIYWARIALPLRAEVLGTKQREFVRLARAANAGPLYIVRHHILPHVRDTAIVLLTLVMGNLILTEASLSFLGAGIPPPQPSLGGMIAEGLSVLERGWWISVFPGIVISLLILSANLLGDWLRDRWDPRLQNL